MNMQTDDWMGKDLIRAIPKPQPSEKGDKCALILALHAEGMTVTEINREMGSHPDTIYSVLKSHSLTPHRKRLTPEQVKERQDKAAELARQGKTIKEIANALGLKYGVVWDALVRAGVSARRAPSGFVLKPRHSAAGHLSGDSAHKPNQQHAGGPEIGSKRAAQ